MSSNSSPSSGESSANLTSSIRVVPVAPTAIDRGRGRANLMVVRLIPSSGGCGAWKLDDKDPFRHWIAFQQIDLATAGDDAPTKTGNCRQSARHMRLIRGVVGYVNIADDVGWHRTPPC